jgi:hypothetical protein
MEHNVKVIPIYDATAPIACTATGPELAARIVQLEHMRTDLTRFERTEHGLVLHFPNRPAIDDHVRAFADDEKGCCTFWGFEVTATTDELTLRWDGPPEVNDFFERLVAWLSSNEPLTAEWGLL